MKAKKQIAVLQNRITHETRERVAAQTHAQLVEAALASARSAAVAPPAAPPAPVAAPRPARTELREYERLSRENYYLAAQYLLNHSGAIIEQKAEERRGGGA